MNAASIVAEWNRRLLALAHNSPDVFVDTPQHLIDEHQRQQTTFSGWTEREVANCEAELGVSFPLVFRQYLLEMGKSPGDLFKGSERAGIDEFDKFRSFAMRLLNRLDPQLRLPRDAVVFLTHQGYTFLYLIASDGFDGPVMQWMELEREPETIAPTFANLVDAELQLMEKVNQDAIESGGYYLTLHPNGGSTRWAPPINSGERPLQGRKL